MAACTLSPDWPLIRRPARQRSGPGDGGMLQSDSCRKRRRRSFTASFVDGDKSAEISPQRLMAQQIMAHVATATGVPRGLFPAAAAHLKAV